MEDRTQDFIRIEATLVVIIILLACLSFCGCTKTEYVTIEKVRTDTTYITKHQRDSIYVHDSTAVERKDSIIKIEHWHTKFVDHAVHDTLYQATHDTIPQPYPVIKEVEKKLSTTERVLIIIGCLSVMALLVYIVLKIKPYLPCR